MARPFAYLLPRSRPRNAAWFGVVLVALLLAGTPALAGPPRQLAERGESAPPAEDAQENAPDAVRDVRPVADRPVPPTGQRFVPPPQSLLSAHSRTASPPPDPFGNGLGTRLRC